MKNFFEKFHSFIFSIISIIGFEITSTSYFQSGINSFLAFSSFFLIVFGIEGFISYRYAKNLKSKLPLPHLVDDIKHIHITSHIFLPLFLYISVCAFIFFNSLTLQTQLIIFTAGITFFSIFEGQRKSFKKEFSFDETLHYIYDSIKIIIFFLLIDVSVLSTKYFDWGNIVLFIFSEIFAFILFLLIIVRKQQFNSMGILYIFVVSIFTALAVLLLSAHMSAISVALIASVIYYLFIGTIHHKINATLNAEIIAEYVLIALIILLALRGIS